MTSVPDPDPAAAAPHPTPAEIARHFGTHAREYAVSRFHAEGQTRVLLLEHLEPVTDEILLDLGSGPGHTALAFAPYVRRVIACDLAAPMLHAAALGARRAAGTGEPMASFERVAADAHALPFRGRALDLVTVRAAAHHFTDLDRALAEIRRVLRRGGRLGIADPTVPDDDPALAGFIRALEQLRDPTTVHLRSPAEWRARLEAAGLRVDFVEASAWELAEGRSLVEWIARAGGSSTIFAQARRRLLGLPDPARRALRVKADGEDVRFDLPRVVMTAKRID